MEPSPANRDITFSPVLLMKNDVFLSTFHQKSQPVDSVLHTEYHTCYTTTTVQYFTGKEKDEETGYGYFGARYMDHELMTMFLSVDRYASRYPSISPYVYCAWNPIKLIDPSGDTVILKGGHSDRVLAQLQTGQMKVSRNENGLLSADLRGKTRDNLSYEEKLIYDAINSSEVTIKIVARQTEMKGDKHVFYPSIEDVDYGAYECLTGGADMGSYYDDNTGRATSYSYIDMDIVESNGYDQGVAHEVSECFLAGKIAIRDKKDVKMAEQNVPNSRMMEAHTKALPEKVLVGGLYRFGIKYGNVGKIRMR